MSGGSNVGFETVEANSETPSMIKPRDVEFGNTTGTCASGWSVKRCALVALGNEAKGQSSQVLTGSRAVDETATSLVALSLVSSSQPKTHAADTQIRAIANMGPSKVRTGCFIVDTVSIMPS